MQRANLDVPWMARFLMVLEQCRLFSGDQWRDINTYNFRVTQRDIEDGFCLYIVMKEICNRPELRSTVTVYDNIMIMNIN